MVQSVPRASLEVVEAQFLFHLLVGLLAGPSCFDERSEPQQRGAWGIVGQVELALVGALLADEPDLVTGWVNATTLTGAIGHPHAHGGESAAQRAFGPVPPSDRTKHVCTERLEHSLCRAWRGIDARILARPTADVGGGIELHVDGVDVLG